MLHNPPGSDTSVLEHRACDSLPVWITILAESPRATHEDLRWPEDATFGDGGQVAQLHPVVRHDTEATCVFERPQRVGKGVLYSNYDQPAGERRVPLLREWEYGGLFSVAFTSLVRRAARRRARGALSW